MTEAGLGVSVDRPGRETWTVHAHRDGTIVSMAKSFPPFADGDVAMEMVIEKQRMDPDWRERWKGWGMYPVRLDRGVIVR